MNRSMVKRLRRYAGFLAKQTGKSRPQLFEMLKRDLKTPKRTVILKYMGVYERSTFNGTKTKGTISRPKERRG